jgi:hypothetical protein
MSSDCSNLGCMDMNVFKFKNLVLLFRLEVKS